MFVRFYVVVSVRIVRCLFEFNLLCCPSATRRNFQTEEQVNKGVASFSTSCRSG